MFHPNSRKLQDWSLPQSWMSWPQPAGDLFALRQITWSSRFWGFGVLRSQEVWTPEQKKLLGVSENGVYILCIYINIYIMLAKHVTTTVCGMLIEHIWKKWWQTLDLKVALFWDETIWNSETTDQFSRNWHGEIICFVANAASTAWRVLYVFMGKKNIRTSSSGSSLLDCVAGTTGGKGNQITDNVQLFLWTCKHGDRLHYSFSCLALGRFTNHLEVQSASPLQCASHQIKGAVGLTTRRSFHQNSRTDGNANVSPIKIGTSGVSFIGT
jgi:hypothetical protein